MKAKRRYVAQDFFHARTLPGLACQEGENGKMALKCAIVRMKTAEVRIFLVVLLNWQKNAINRPGLLLNSKVNVRT